jgi:sulfur carrier protein
VNVTVNGAAAVVIDGWSVAELVRDRADEQRKVAVAHNGEVVPRAEWETTRLSEGDTLEILAPVAGG